VDSDQDGTPLAALGALRWPTRLSANHRQLAAIQLRAVPVHLRQSVLDILDRRLQQTEGGAEPLHYGPLAYLKTLCERAASGRLVLPPPAVLPTPTDAGALDLARLQAQLRVAHGDHAHWQRLMNLHTDPERQASIAVLVEQTAAVVAKLEAELAAVSQPPR
jgi:hypothetical protein